MTTENIILWTEVDTNDRVLLKRALESATAPILEAYACCMWQNEAELVFETSKVKPDLRLQYYSRLYFYLSGYGDAQHQERAWNNRQLAPF